MLNGARPITPEERELVQNFIMEYVRQILGIVAKERNLPAELSRTRSLMGEFSRAKKHCKTNS